MSSSHSHHHLHPAGSSSRPLLRAPAFVLAGTRNTQSLSKSNLSSSCASDAASTHDHSSETEQCHSSGQSTHNRAPSSMTATQTQKQTSQSQSPFSQPLVAAREPAHVLNLSEGDQMAEGEEDSEDGLQPPSQLPPRLRSVEDGVSRLRNQLAEVSVCHNCQGRFRSSTLKLGGRLCSNCNKIVESVQSTAQRHQGSSRVVFKHLGHVEMVLTCQEGHEWSVGMKSRKAKSWCGLCRDRLRVQ